MFFLFFRCSQSVVMGLMRVVVVVILVTPIVMVRVMMVISGTQ